MPARAFKAQLRFRNKFSAWDQHRSDENVYECNTSVGFSDWPRCNFHCSLHEAIMQSCSYDSSTVGDLCYHSSYLGFLAFLVTSSSTIVYEIQLHHLCSATIMHDEDILTTVILQHGLHGVILVSFTNFIFILGQTY